MKKVFKVNGWSILGIHGSGDDSHFKWEWY